MNSIFLKFSLSTVGSSHMVGSKLEQIGRFSICFWANPIVDNGIPNNSRRGDWNHKTKQYGSEQIIRDDLLQKWWMVSNDVEYCQIKTIKLFGLIRKVELQWIILVIYLLMSNTEKCKNDCKMPIFSCYSTFKKVFNSKLK